MKKFVSLAVVLILSLAGIESGATGPVVREDTWTRSYAIDTASPTLSISNIWGSVDVHAADVSRIEVSISERRSAPDQALFDRSLEELALVTKADGNGVSIAVGGEDRSWQHQDPCPGCRVDYQFRVTVPRGTQVEVGTVMDGRVRIEGIQGMVSANNVNGPINISGLNNCGAISNVNGPVDLDFAQAPLYDCDIETINGDITLDVPASSGLDIALDLFNGNMVSDSEVEDVELPATVERASENGVNRYRIEKPAGLRVGGGGPTYRIASLNGDLVLKTN